MLQNDAVVYERLSWEVVGSFSGAHSKPVNCVAFCSNGEGQLLSQAPAFSSLLQRLGALPRGTPLTLPAPSHHRSSDPPLTAGLYAVTVGRDNLAVLWEAATYKELARHELSSSATAAVWAPGSNRLQVLPSLCFCPST